jgi:hypothetical protein
LRNIRPKLNISYIFMANLNINLAQFYKVERLFDKGVDRSICWLSLLDRKDTFFSIDRQLYRVGEGRDALSETEKQKIYEWGGGHALLTRYLSHLMLDGEISLETKPQQILDHSGIHAACTAIWADLEQKHKHFLIDLVKGNGAPLKANVAIKKTLTNYGILKEQAFFSPLFESFVKTQQKIGGVLHISCDGTQIKVIIKTVDEEQVAPLNRLPPEKEGLLPLRARNLLCYLLGHQGEVCSRDQLIKIGWPLDQEGGVSNQALDRQIERLKSWLKEQPQLSQYLAIETVWGIGYKLVVKD